LIILLFLIHAPRLPAQTSPAASPSAPAYQVLRFDEDWSFLRDHSRRSDFWDPLKHIPLNDNGWFASLGGELRERYEGFSHSSFGAGPQDPNGYLLERYLFHTDIHAGAHARFFAQLQSGVANGRVGGPRATDQDQFEFHQAFADIKFGTGPRKTAFLRLGRQEFEFGSGRLISAGELLNVRRSFDGVRVSGQLGPWTFHSIAVRPVLTNPGVLDDKPDHAQLVWGAGLVHPNPRAKGGYFSVYYIGFDRRAARFDSGLGQERRQTFGSRVFGAGANWDYNYELIAQWGSFRDEPIRAFAISTDTGRSFANARFKPRIGVKTDVGSGDRDAEDTTLQTFNPLFPNTAYSGKIGLLGPQNIIDVEPSVRLKPTPRITTMAEWGVFWRESLHDGIYGLSLSPFKTGQLSRSRFVANQPDLQLTFAVDRHLTLGAILTQFRAGSFIKDTPPSKNVSYANLFFTYKF
jgi:hypothetical protein